MKEIKKIAVIGGGLMGRQIGLNACVYGLEARVYDLAPQVCEAVKTWKDEYLAGRIKKGRMTEEQTKKIDSLFSVESDLAKAVNGVDLVIEAIVEKEDIKRSFFKQLNGLIPADTIIGTNSSFMISSKFADCVDNPSRLANLHYYNPALVMKLVEIVKGPHTSEDTVQSLYAFCEKTGKTPVIMQKELPGFAGSRISRVVANEARWLVANGYLTPKEVDIVCENGLNYPMGPFRLNDFTGIDITFNGMVEKYKETGEKPPMYDEYEAMVKEGHLGRKTGHGFYDYDK